MLALVLWVLGIPPALPQEPKAPKVLIPGSPEARAFLREQDDILNVYLNARLLTALSAIENDKPSRKIRRRARGWNKFVARRTGEILENPDPLAALLDVWAFAQRIDDYVQTGKGRDDFGEAQPVVQGAARDILDAAVATANAHLDPQAFDVARENVRIFARDHPLVYDRGFLSGLFTATDVAFSVVDVGQNTLGTVASLPLMPFRAGEGIRRGTEGIRDFNITARDFNVTAAEFSETASRFTDVVEELPERTRKEVEILFQGVDDRSSTMTLIARDLRAISENFDSGLQAADKLAPDVREAVSHIDSATATAGRAAENIQLAAAELRQLVDGLTALLDRYESRTSAGEAKQGFDPEEYREAAHAIETGSTEVRLLLQEIDKLVNPTEKKKYSEGYHRFDIREYIEAARAIEKGSIQVRGILADSTTMAENEALLKRAAESTERISARLESLVQYLLIRFALFFAFVLAVLLAYRVLRSRLAPVSGV